MQVLGGKAFLEHLHEPEALPGQVTSTFTLHINFRGQRFRSRPTACACEPDIQEGFLLELHKESAGWLLFHSFKKYFIFMYFDRNQPYFSSSASLQKEVLFVQFERTIHKRKLVYGSNLTGVRFSRTFLKCVAMYLLCIVFVRKYGCRYRFGTIYFWARFTSSST